ncbi:unnamed protein product [Bursaphelenchus xylophilus]|uniref:Transcription elongation factor SPT5 n=1 Tax=Bursaphelenchus xylophilus TaxID=6326 RepID=A0A1I7RUT9_BURXY|nr:unnamed protein product [Bursaphelenchus xylophilus]CAG9105459.1 unnamed protein product [Bursaphelenchus xylophilus]
MSSSEEDNVEVKPDPSSEEEGSDQEKSAPSSPAPARKRKIESDDDSDANESGKEDEAEEPTPKKKTKFVRDSSDESDEEEEEDDDDDEEEEEEEEEERPKKSKKKRRKRRTVHDFIQDDVEVDDDEEEEEVQYSDEDINFDPSERRLAEKALREQEAMERKKHDQRNKLANMTEEEMARYFEEKHAMERQSNYSRDHDAYDEITQNSLLPTTRDPNLWIVKVTRIGEEKMVVLQMLRKCIAMENSGNPLHISSIVCKEGLKGMLYIEAHKKANVARLIEGVSAVNQYDIKMVPIEEMVDTLKVVKNIPQLKVNDYCRLKKTMYKGDLAQVDWVDVAQNKICLRLVPRIDYKKKRGALRDMDDDDEDDEVFSYRNALSKKSAKNRPPAKPFDVEKIKALGAEVSHDGDFIICEGQRFRRFLVYKIFPLTSVTTENLNPTVEELKYFQDKLSTDPDFLREIARARISDTLYTFGPGDWVEVCEGELTNLRGKVVSVDKDEVIISPDHQDLKQNLKFNASELKKYFKPGDHVRVLGGQHQGLTGTVVKVDENAVVVLSDLNLDEMKVRPHNLKLDTQVFSGVDQMGQFQFHDLVSLDANTVGVILRLEKDFADVLTMNNTVQRVKSVSIQPRKNADKGRCMDSVGNTVQKGDLVKVSETARIKGFREGDDIIGEVKYVFRAYLFLHSRKYKENSGIFVVRKNLVTLLGAKNSNQSLNAPLSVNGQLNEDLLKSPRHHSQVTSDRSNGGQTPSVHSSQMSSRNGAMTPRAGVPSAFRGQGQQPRRDTTLVGKTVRVIKGPMKGYFGIVKDATDSTVRLELHAMPKVINVDRTRVMQVGSNGNILDSSSMSAFGTPAARTPTVIGGKTPIYGAGAQTPLYGAGSQTPMHDSIGSRTPHYGATTPAYGDGGRTPNSNAWDPQNVTATPAHTTYDDDDEKNDYYSAAHTPAYSHSGSHYNASTPGRDSKMYSEFAATSPYPRSNFDNYTEKSTSSVSAAPAKIAESDLLKGDWCQPDLLVKVKDNFDDDEVKGLTGTITKRLDGECMCYFEDLEFSDDSADRKIAFKYLLPVPPAAGDKARIIFGDGNGKTGVVVSEDNDDMVIRLDDSSIKLTFAENVCKLA